MSGALLTMLSGGVAGGGGGNTPPDPGAFTVTITPTSVEKFGIGAGYVTSGNVTASSTGGTAPYSYAWTMEADINNGSEISPLSPSSATTKFRGYTPNGDYIAATFKVTATDSAGTPLVGYGYLNVYLRSTSDGSDGQIQ